MKALTHATREEVYNAPIIDWNNNTYTPVSNKSIMDLMDEQMDKLGLVRYKEHYSVARDLVGNVKGVIGSYDIMTGDEDFGQRVMFRNSYDKSMSFAVVVGSVVWICSNGCISGDFQYKRIHRGVISENSSTTAIEIKDNIIGGFELAQKAFEHNKHQLDNMKEIKVEQSTVFDILGQLFFKMGILSVNQVSIINKEFKHSPNFRHLSNIEFTAYDLYNHITEALKVSHPLTYFNDHIKTHNLFEQMFGI